MLNPLHSSRINSLTDLDSIKNLDNLIKKAEKLLAKSIPSTDSKEKWDKPWDYYVALENIAEAKRIADKIANENSPNPINPWAEGYQNELTTKNFYLLPISNRLSSSYASKAGKITIRSRLNQFVFSAITLLKRQNSA